MMLVRPWQSVAGRLVFAAAVTLAGAGAGVAAALATSSSGLARAAGGAAGGVAGLLAATWIDRARSRREATAAAVCERDRVLDAVVSDAGRDASVLGVLLPTRQDAAPFRGRAADLAWLKRWWEDPRAHPVAIVTGPVGVGKTRLVTQFASLRPEPWVAGWLHAGCGGSVIATVKACGEPALVLVDEADGRPDLSALLDDLAGASPGSQVRVILITRTVEALQDR